jgi:pimeloyl-ACP methyl ester carboxylesterase
MEVLTDRVSMSARGALRLPAGHSVELPGRGRTFVRDVPGPPGAPTVLLLHGWTATADLNFFSAYATLGEHYRVLALDHHGHGRGIRRAAPFTLEDCADDAAALLEHLGAGPVIAVGYSMGGPVAELLWHRHPHLVAGLVLCATSAVFRGSPREHALFSAIRPALMVARRSTDALRSRVALRLLTGPGDWELHDWARGEVARHDWVAVLQAGQAIGEFDGRAWLDRLDVPTGVLVTSQDRVVPPERQVALAKRIPGATIRRVIGDHPVCIAQPERFVPVLGEAVHDVAVRAQAPVKVTSRSSTSSSSPLRSSAV